MADSGKPGGLPAALTSEDSTGSVGSGGSIADLKRFWEGKSTTPAKGSARSSLAGTPTAQRSRSFSSDAVPLPGTKQEGEEGSSVSPQTRVPPGAGTMTAAAAADAGALTLAAAAAVPGSVPGGSHETESEGPHPAPALEGAMLSELAGFGDASTDAWDNGHSSGLNAAPAPSSPGKEAGSPAAATAATGEGGEQQEQGHQQKVQPTPERVLSEPSEAGNSASSAVEQQEGTGSGAGGPAADQLDECIAATAQVEAATAPETDGGMADPETEAPWGVTANDLPAAVQPSADAGEQREQRSTSAYDGSPATGNPAPLPSVETDEAQPEDAAVATSVAPGELEAALTTGNGGLPVHMVGEESSAASGAGAAAAGAGEEEGAWAEASSESLLDVAEHSDEAAEHSSSEAAVARKDPGETVEAGQQESSTAGFAAFGQNPAGAVAEVSGSPRNTLKEQGSLPEAAAAQACPQLVAELDNDGSDGDAFGEFAEFHDPTEAATEAGIILAQPAEQQVPEPAAEASEDDEFADFGDFDAAPDPAPAAATTATLPPAQQALGPTTLQRAESLTAPAAQGSQPAGLLDLPPTAFRAAAAALLASVQAPLPQTAGGPSDHPATAPLTLASLAAVYPQLAAAPVKGQAAAAGEAAGGGLLHWRGSRSEARFLGRLDLSSTSAGAKSKSRTSNAAQSRRPAAPPAADLGSDSSETEVPERAAPPGAVASSHLPAAEQGPLGTAAAQVHSKMVTAPVGVAAPQLGDEFEAGLGSSGAAPQGEKPAAEAAMWDQDPFATAGPWQQQEPAVPAAAVPLAAAGALAAQPGPLARGAQQLPAHGTSHVVAALPLPHDPFAAPAAPGEAPAAPEGPLAKGAAQLGAPPSQPGAAWDPFAASDQFVAPRPGPLQAAAQHLPAHSATATDPFAGVELPMAAAVPTSAAAAGGLDWAGDPFQGPAGWEPASSASAWANPTRDTGAWGAPAAAGPADPFAASAMPVIVASSAVGGAAALSTAAAARQQQQGEESACVEGSFSNGAQPALEPGWGEGTEGGPPAGEAAHGFDGWGEDGWSDFAEAAVPGPPAAALDPVPCSVAHKTGDEVGGDTVVADEGGVGQGKSSSAGGGGGAAVDAILAQMPDLSFMLSPSLVRP